VDNFKTIKPKGETNLFSGFEEAFKFRAEGMDALYLFSDGLPTAGPGLPANTNQLSDQQQTEALTRHLRNRLKYWIRPVENQRVKINAIHFFFESPQVGAFLWALARENDGSFVGMSRP
jgi:hypothetical protein